MFNILKKYGLTGYLTRKERKKIKANNWLNYTNRHNRNKRVIWHSSRINPKKHPHLNLDFLD